MTKPDGGEKPFTVSVHIRRALGDLSFTIGSQTFYLHLVANDDDARRLETAEGMATDLRIALQALYNKGRTDQLMRDMPVMRNVPDAGEYPRLVKEPCNDQT